MKKNITNNISMLQPKNKFTPTQFLEKNWFFSYLLRNKSFGLG